MSQINREDMLELTRRMTLKRNCFTRIAGAYFDEEGFVDGTFNRHFLKLSVREQEKNLGIAKAVPYAKTNSSLIRHHFAEADEKAGSTWQLLMALRECELKNDALLDVFYEIIGEKFQYKKQYAIYFFYGNYDVPAKASDKEYMLESEEVYQFMIGAICPISGDYDPQAPICGFLFPSFSDRSSDIHSIDIFEHKALNGIGSLKEILW
jgi:hypothetical protein